MTTEELKELNKNELVQMCDDNGLSTEGKKKEMRARLSEFFAKKEEEVKSENNSKNFSGEY